MSNEKNVVQFADKLLQLNTQLIKIEKKLTVQTDYLICFNHKQCVDPAIKFHDQLIILKEKNNKKQKLFGKRRNHRLIDFFFPIKTDKMMTKKWIRDN
ncbi:hypothetical protein ACS127_14280 [Amphibacillus sp. Q70]|uniref:hypothetical protein n=1 Tax=Amphibacillus sp. Q70 TaxID=3453416 RepID=UPI003F853A0B